MYKQILILIILIPALIIVRFLYGKQLGAIPFLLIAIGLFLLAYRQISREKKRDKNLKIKD